MKKQLLVSVLAAGLFVGLTSEILSDNGKAGATGSPGEVDCTNCHNSYALNSGGGSIALNTGTTNNQYTPGVTYQMTFTVTYSGRNLFGLGVEALNSSNNNAGTFVITDAASTRTKTALIGTVSRISVVHQFNGGASANSKVFSFSWTAPAAGTGNVTFYYCGLAANANGSESGDYVYRGSTVLTEMNTSGIEEASSNIDFSVFPTLIQDQATIRVTPVTSGTMSVQLFDLTGRQVRSESLDVIAGDSREIRWEGLSSLSKGTYLVSILNGNATEVKRIVIQ